MGVEKMVAVGMEAGKGLLIDALLRRPLEMVPAESCFKSFHFLPIHLSLDHFTKHRHIDKD